MLYAAKYEQYLFSEKFLAFEHGGIIYDIYHSFHFLVNPYRQVVIKKLNSYLKSFLTRIFNYFKSYTNEQLEKFVHEDPARFTAWDSMESKEMPQNQEMIDYYREFALHIIDSVENHKKTNG